MCCGVVVSVVLLSVMVYSYVYVYVLCVYGLRHFIHSNAIATAQQKHKNKQLLPVVLLKLVDVDPAVDVVQSSGRVDARLAVQADGRCVDVKMRLGFVIAMTEQ